MSEQVTANDFKVGFSELLKSLRTYDSKNRSKKLGECIEYELQDLMYSINEFNKGGKLNITVDFEIGERNEVLIKSSVKTTKPKATAPKNVYFKDLKGQLYSDDPNQMHWCKTVIPIQETHQKGATTND